MYIWSIEWSMIGLVSLRRNGTKDKDSISYSTLICMGCFPRRGGPAAAAPPAPHKGRISLPLMTSLQGLASRMVLNVSSPTRLDMYTSIVSSWWDPTNSHEVFSWGDRQREMENETPGVSRLSSLLDISHLCTPFVLYPLFVFRSFHACRPLNTARWKINRCRL
jgi:hypothetical protein